MNPPAVSGAPGLQLAAARALASFGLALWFGGGVGTLLSTRVVFANTSGTPMAGTLAAGLLKRYTWLASAALALLIGSWLLGLRGAITAAWAAGGVLFLISELAIWPAVRRLRTAMGGSRDNVPKEDPRRRRFGMLHGVSMLLIFLELGCAAAAILALSFG